MDSISRTSHTETGLHVRAQILTSIHCHLYIKGKNPFRSSVCFCLSGPVWFIKGTLAMFVGSCNYCSNASILLVALSKLHFVLPISVTRGAVYTEQVWPSVSTEWRCTIFRLPVTYYYIYIRFQKHAKTLLGLFSNFWSETSWKQIIQFSSIEQKFIWQLYQKILGTR